MYMYHDLNAMWQPCCAMENQEFIFFTTTRVSFMGGVDIHVITLYQTTNFRLFQIERLCRRQSKI